MPRGKQKAPEGETKAQAFTRIGTTRINNAVKAIELMIAMANKNTYEYTSDQQKIILDSLDTAVQKVKDAFGGKHITEGGITL